MGNTKSNHLAITNLSLCPLPEPSKMSPEDKEEFGEDPKAKKPAAVVVSGASASEDAAFPKEAVR